MMRSTAEYTRYIEERFQLRGSSLAVHPLRYQAERCDGRHEQDKVVELDKRISGLLLHVVAGSVPYSIA